MLKKIITLMPINRPYNLPLMFVSGPVAFQHSAFFHYPLLIAVQAEFYPQRGGDSKYFSRFFKIFDSWTMNASKRWCIVCNCRRKARFQLMITDNTSELLSSSSIVHESIFHLFYNSLILKFLTKRIVTGWQFSGRSPFFCSKNWSFFLFAVV